MAETPTTLTEIQTAAGTVRLGAQVRVRLDLDPAHPSYAGRTGTVAWLCDPAGQRFSVGIEFDTPGPAWFAPDEVDPNA